MLLQTLKNLLKQVAILFFIVGNIDENLKLIKSVPYIDKFTQKKHQLFINF